jgi:hypothetical protein
MVAIINEAIIDISSNKNALLVEIDKKIGAGLLSFLNDDFHNDKLYPISIDRKEIGYLLDGIDARLRLAHELKLQFFETLSHDFICGISSLASYGAKCAFTLPGTVINREFSVIDRVGYFDVIHAAFQDFVLTASSLFENLVRMIETLVRKVIINSPKRPASPGNETLQLYLEFLQILSKLQYRPTDDLHSCLAGFDGFFKSFLIPFYKLRGSFIHGYQQNLIIDPTGVCLVRRIDNSFSALSTTDLMLDQFSGQIFENLKNLTAGLMDCLTKKIADPGVKIPI